MAAIALVSIGVFWHGLGAGLVSDDFDFYRRARDAGLLQALNWLVPNNYFWYRPVQDLAFWGEVRVFGYSPSAFHAVSLAGHTISAILLYRLALKFGCTYIGALAAGLIFVASVHAHEVVWWWADLHYAFGGPLILGSLLAWVTRRRVTALVLAVAALLSDESSVLIAPLAMAAEFFLGESASLSDRLRQVFRGPVLLVGIVAIYFAFRLLVGHGIWGESAACRSPACVLSGLSNYGVRLLLRPDRAYGIYASHKAITYVFGLVVLSAIVAVAIKRWRSTPAISFGLVWATGAVGFFVLALWPYASDRFLYYPDMGLALTLGGFVSEAIALWVTGSRALKGAVMAAGVLLVVWIGFGIHMLEVRAGGWIDAGREATSIVNQIFEAEPDLPSNALLDIRGAPDSSLTIFPPGNTGPYIFRNGLQSAVQLRFHRDDISVAWPGHPATGSHPVVIVLRVDANGSVTAAGP